MFLIMFQFLNHLYFSKSRYDCHLIQLVGGFRVVHILDEREEVSGSESNRKWISMSSNIVIMLLTAFRI